MVAYRAGLPLRTLGRSTADQKQLHNSPVFLVPLHKEYGYYYGQWVTARDMNAGEWAVKARGVIYLPRIPAQTDPEYLQFLEKATYYNGVGITAQSMAGSLFLHEPNLAIYKTSDLTSALSMDTLPENLKKRVNLDKITKDKQSFDEFIRILSDELILTSRAGVLIDLPRESTTEPKPYITLYEAEQILNWRYRLLDNGEKVLDQVILWEITEVPGLLGMEEITTYRILGLDEKGEYFQEIIVPGGPLAPSSPDALSGATRTKIYPQIKGERLTEIPFQFFGAKVNTGKVNKLILTDIMTMNLSHYRSYAELEHGRFYTAMPTYVIAGEGINKPAIQGTDQGSSYIVGPNNLWLIGENDKADILEFTGSGLTYLENALDQKQAQMATLGSKLQVQGKKMAAQSGAASQMAALGEQATLNSISHNIDDGMNNVFGWVLKFANLDESYLIWLTMNKDFERADISAREMRAIESLYERGLLDIPLIYSTFRDAGIVKSEISLEEFEVIVKKRLAEREKEKEQEFNNQVKLKNSGPSPNAGGGTRGTS